MFWNAVGSHEVLQRKLLNDVTLPMDRSSIHLGAFTGFISPEDQVIQTMESFISGPADNTCSIYYLGCLLYFAGLLGF